VTSPSEPVKTFVLLGLILLIVISTIALGILVCVYKNDLPFERRHYMTVSKPPFEVPDYIDDRNSSLASLDDTNFNRDYPRQKKQKHLAILSAKVTSSIQIDQENFEKVSFQVITKENGKILVSTKRTYSNFRSLDDILRTKYSRHITRGHLHKRDLPIAGNLTSIRSIGLLRE
jgi:hypothetical protein